MRWFDKPAILAAINDQQALAAIEHAFHSHSAGETQSIAVGHLRFDRPPGDFHVKGARVNGRPLFAIKMASSFFENPRIGLPSSNGMMLVFDANSGTPMGALLDEGSLTDLRTAVAGAIAARLIAPVGARTLGVVGAGTQAALQACWIAKLLNVDDVLIWARDPIKSDVLAQQLVGEGLAAKSIGSIADLCRESDVVVTTTPSRQPLIDISHLRPGLRIVAVGADASGKREVALDVIKAADVLLVDSREQCLQYGECNGMPDPARLVEIGEALTTGKHLAMPAEAVAVADLTGIGGQDAAIAELAWQQLTAIPQDA